MPEEEFTSAIVKDIIRQDDAIIISLTGEIDMNVAPDLRVLLMQVMDKDYHTIRLDMSDVNFMDSSGLAVLVEALQMSHQREKKLQLSSLHPRVRSVFEISRLVDLFEIIENDK